VEKRPGRRVERAKSFIWKALGGIWKLRKGYRKPVRASRKFERARE